MRLAWMILFVILAGVAEADIYTNLVSLWKFDEASTSGGTIIDSVNIYNLTNIGLDNTTGQINNAYDFEYADATDTGNGTYTAFTTMTSSFTASAWVKIESFPDHMCVMSTFDYVNPNYYGWSVQVRTNGSLGFWIVTGDGLINYCTGQGGSKHVHSTVWSMVTYAYNDTENNMQMYVNGQSSLNVTCNYNPVYATTFAGLYIGNSQDSASCAKFDGVIDEPKLWNRTLGKEEIAALYANESTGTQYPWTIGDSTPPILSDITCTSPDPDDTTEPYKTDDTTPTFTLTTDEAAYCEISDMNSSYSTCTTTNGTAHTCTVVDADKLPYGTTYAYLNCTDQFLNSRTQKLEMYITTCACPGLANDWPWKFADNCNISANCNISTSSVYIADTATNLWNFSNYANVTAHLFKWNSTACYMCQKIIGTARFRIE